MVWRFEIIKEVFYFAGSLFAIILTGIKIYEYFKQKPKIFFDVNNLRFFKDSENNYILDITINLINKGKEETAIDKIEVIRNIFPDEEVQAPLSNKRVLGKIGGFKLPIKEPIRKEGRFNLDFKKDYPDVYIELTVVDINGKEITKNYIADLNGEFSDIKLLQKHLGKNLKDILKSYNI